MEIPVTMDFLAVSSYGKGKTSSGEVQLTKDLDVSLAGREVIVVEDIADTGLTLNYLLTMLRSRQPATLKVAAFLVEALSKTNRCPRGLTSASRSRIVS